jgi:hypothetical protein
MTMAGRFFEQSGWIPVARLIRDPSPRVIPSPEAGEVESHHGLAAEQAWRRRIGANEHGEESRRSDPESR